MDWLRKIVSGKRRRFNEGGYDLDITYITNRVLAMSFPASGVEQMYRNSISDVRHAQYKRKGCELPERATRQQLPRTQHEWKNL